MGLHIIENYSCPVTSPVCMSFSFLAHGPKNSKSILVKGLCVFLTQNFNKDLLDGQILTPLWCQAVCA